MKDVIIIGGGIIGLSSAYYLLKEGYKVTVIDKEDITTGASHLNAGYSTPGHIFPLAAPGVITQALKQLWDNSSPLYIHPRLDFDFFDWAWKFRKAATKNKVELAIPVLKEIGLHSKSLYEEILETLDISYSHQKNGLLVVYQTKKMEKEEIKKAVRVKHENLEVEVLSKEQLLKIQPALSEESLGAVHYLCNSHSTPNFFMERLKSWLMENGVTFLLNEKVSKLESKNSEITGIHTEYGYYKADTYVLAAGVWTKNLIEQLGCSMPLQGGKGYSIDVHRATGITIPAILAEAKVAVTPMRNFTRFAGTMEFSGNNNLIRKDRVAAISTAVSNYYDGISLHQAELGEANSGLRSVTPDGLPYIGKISNYKNLVIATGHAMVGWSLGAATGKIVSQIVADQKPIVSLNPFYIERFN